MFLWNNQAPPIVMHRCGTASLWAALPEAAFARVTSKTVALLSLAKWERVHDTWTFEAARQEVEAHLQRRVPSGLFESNVNCIGAQKAGGQCNLALVSFRASLT